MQGGTTDLLLEQGLVLGTLGAGQGRHRLASDAGVAIAQQLAQRNFLSFTRSMERSADQAALAFLDANKWSAQGMLDLFHHLEDQELLSRAQQDPYVMTHPVTRERIDFVPPGVEGMEYQVTSIIKKMIDPERAVGFLTGHEEGTPEQALPYLSADSLIVFPVQCLAHEALHCPNGPENA